MAQNQIPQALLPNESIPDFDAMSAQAAADQTMAPAAPPQAQAPEFEIPLLQNDTDTIMPIPQDQADTAIRSGLYSPKRDQEFIIMDKYGNRNVVQGEYLREALNQGMLLESSQQRHEREIEEKYGNDDIAAGIEGAARGAAGLASLGSKAIAQIPGLGGAEFTPDEAMAGLARLTGDEGVVNEQALRDRAEANPVASVLGNIAGTIGSFGASGAAKGVQALEKKVASTILKDAAKAGVGKKIAASLASKAVGGAVEGAYFGTGELLSEESLGKADFNAENLLVSAGMGALLGGAISGGAQGLVEAGKGVAPLAKLIASPFTRKVSDSMDAKVSSARVLGITPTQLRKLEIRNPKIVDDMQSYLKDDLRLTLGDSAEDLAAKNAALMDSSGKQIGKVLDEVDVVLKDAPELRPSAKAVWGNVYSKVYKEVEDIFSTATGPGVNKARKEATKFLDEIYALENSGAEFNATQLQKIKRAQDKLLKWNKEPGKWSMFEDMVYTTRTAIRDEIDLLAHGLQSRGLADNLSSQLKAANRQYSAANVFGDFLETKALKAADKSFDFMFLNAARDVGLDISRKLVVLGKMEKANQFADKLLSKSLTGFLEPAGQKIKQVAIPMSIMNSEFAKKFEDGKYKKPKDVAEAYSNMHDNFARYGQDPEAFTSRVNRSTAAVYDSAPNTSTALDTLAIQAAMFLSSKMPKRTVQGGMLDMFKKPKPPSKLDLMTFEKYLTAVEHPETIFKDFENGRISHESAEVLRAVYPNMFTRLQEQVMEKVAKNPDMPYNKKLQLGILMDVPTDESLLPQNVLGLQSLFTDEAEDAEGMVNPTVGGAQQIDSAGRQATETQSIDEI